MTHSNSTAYRQGTAPQRAGQSRLLYCMAKGTRPSTGPVKEQRSCGSTPQPFCNPAPENILSAPTPRKFERSTPSPRPDPCTRLRTRERRPHAA